MTEPEMMAVVDFRFTLQPTGTYNWVVIPTRTEPCFKSFVVMPLKFTQ